mgnify:CR=1 FL=1
MEQSDSTLLQTIIEEVNNAEQQSIQQPPPVQQQLPAMTVENNLAAMPIAHQAPTSVGKMYELFNSVQERCGFGSFSKLLKEKGLSAAVVFVLVLLVLSPSVRSLIFKLFQQSELNIDSNVSARVILALVTAIIYTLFGTFFI